MTASRPEPRGVYWAWAMRAELGAFSFSFLMFGVAVLTFLMFGVDVWISEKLRKGEHPAGRISRGSWLRLPVLLCLATVLVSSLIGLGRPVGGLFVFDEQGVPQRATAQVFVLSGGKSKVEHLVLRTFGPNGETRALHRVGFASGREPLAAAQAFWDEDRLRSIETLEILATSEQVRSAVPTLADVESRMLHVDDDEAVFQRRDGAEVRVSTEDVLQAATPHEGGCRTDVTFHRSANVEGLIEAKEVPWPRADHGCPSVAPAGVRLFRSADAAFGEITTLLTLRDGDETRWQVSLPTATAAEEPILLGAFPATDSLTVVAADGTAPQIGVRA